MRHFFAFRARTNTDSARAHKHGRGRWYDPGMRLRVFSTALALLACATPAGAQPKDPPPIVKVLNLTWTIAELAIRPHSPVASCSVWWGENLLPTNRLFATGTLDAKVARIVGLRPATTYEWIAFCAGSEIVRGTFRTMPAAGPLPSPPQVPSIATSPAPGPFKTFVVTATFAAPGAVPTACWWEHHHTKLDRSFPGEEVDCTGAGTTQSFRPIGGGWVRFAMRNAAAQVPSTALEIPE